MRTVSLFLLTATLLASCAMTPSANRYQADLDALEVACAARNGYLQPTGRTGSDRPNEDYSCRVTSGPSDRIQRSGS